MVTQRLFFTISAVIITIQLLLCSPVMAITALETSIDRNPATKGEYLVLSVYADDDISTSELDTSALMKEFTVGRTSVSHSTKIINFDSRKETHWQILIAPKKSGTITIPSLVINNIRSKPIQLKVVESGANLEQMKNLFIRSTLSTQSAYVGQLITYKVKLYLGVELQRGVLSAPEIDGAQIQQVGEDRDTTEIVNGKRFRVIERTYAIIADKSGELTVAGAHFSGDVLVQEQTRRGMFSFNQSRPMQARATDNTLTIEAIPNNYHGQWLVADLVALDEQWPEQQEFRVGEPITRTFNLIASNADKESLPELNIKMSNGLKLYPEKPQRNSFVRDNQVISQLTQTVAIVPTQSGEYLLPAIEVPWWNPHTKTQELAQLPQRVLTVIAGVEQAEEKFTTPLATKQTNYWFWTTIGFALLWLLTLIIWRMSFKKQQTIHHHFSSNGQQSSEAGQIDEPQERGLATKQHPRKSQHFSYEWQKLTQACEQQNAGKVISALQHYYRQQAGKTLSLIEIAKLSPTLSQQITLLQQQTYSQDGSTRSFDFHSLLNLIKQTPWHADSKKNESALSSLNPH